MELNLMGQLEHEATQNCTSASHFYSYSVSSSHWLIDLHKEKHNYFPVASSWVSSANISNYAQRGHSSQTCPATDMAEQPWNSTQLMKYN